MERALSEFLAREEARPFEHYAYTSPATGARSPLACGARAVRGRRVPDRPGGRGHDAARARRRRGRARARGRRRAVVARDKATRERERAEEARALGASRRACRRERDASARRPARRARSRGRAWRSARSARRPRRPRPRASASRDRRVRRAPEPEPRRRRPRGAQAEGGAGVAEGGVRRVAEDVAQSRRDPPRGTRAASPAAAARRRARSRTRAAPPRPRPREPIAAALRIAFDPMVGVAAGDALVLYRTVLVGQRGYRQGLVLDRAALGAWLDERVIRSSRPRARGRACASTAASTRAGRAGALRVRAPLRRAVRRAPRRARARAAPGRRSRRARSTRWSRVLLALGAAGLFAVHRTAAVVMHYAERRSNFAAAVTHELKTPLTAIRMYAEMLRDGLVPSEAKRQEYYATITGESERLSRLVDNVLEFSKLEGGRRELAIAVGMVGPGARGRGREARAARRARGLRARGARRGRSARGALRPRRAAPGAVQPGRQRDEVREGLERPHGRARGAPRGRGGDAWPCATSAPASRARTSSASSSRSTAASRSSRAPPRAPGSGSRS